MGSFSYSFSFSILHSFWQSVLLILVYAGIQVITGKQSPVSKRNILFFLLLSQFILSFLTFFVYYNDVFGFYGNFIDQDLNLINSGPWPVEKIADWILAGYLCISGFKAAHLIYSWKHFKNNCDSNYIKPAVELRLFTMVKASEFGIKRKVRLWFSHRVTTPLTFGFLKPVILMPVALLNQLTMSEAESLIIHELSHIKNNDYLLNWLLVISETLFFYNPFIKIITGKIRLEREKNCDVEVLQFKYSGIHYAETLLKAAKFKSYKNNIFQLTAVFRRNELIQRVSFFTKEQNLFFCKRKPVVPACLMIFFALMINVFILSHLKNHYSVIAEKQIFFSPVILAENKISQPIPKQFSDQQRDRISNGEFAVAEFEKKQLPVLANKIPQLKQQAIYEMEGVYKEAEAVDVLPVVSVEVEDNNKEIIIKEENSSTGKTMTKAYSMKWEDGKWVTRLLWMITEVAAANANRDDSLCLVKDTVLEYLPSVQ